MFSGSLGYASLLSGLNGNSQREIARERRRHLQQKHPRRDAGIGKSPSSDGKLTAQAKCGPPLRGRLLLA
eukprot:948903-Pyramimonas_sp.AAC.1